MILVRQLWKIGAALLLGGCISTNFSPSTSKQLIDPATDGNYTVTGFAASRHWSSRLFYGIPLGPDRPYNAIRGAIPKSGSLRDRVNNIPPPFFASTRLAFFYYRVMVC